jgi:hypothetical protein
VARTWAVSREARQLALRLVGSSGAAYPCPHYESHGSGLIGMSGATTTHEVVAEADDHARGEEAHHGVLDGRAQGPRLVVAQPVVVLQPQIQHSKWRLSMHVSRSVCVWVAFREGGSGWCGRDDVTWRGPPHSRRWRRAGWLCT